MSKPKRLVDIPMDILLELVLYLDVPDALSLVSSCRQLNVLRAHHSFWHALVQNLDVPLACPPFSDYAKNPKELILRTVQRQRALLSSLNPTPVRVQRYLKCWDIETICHVPGTNLYLTYGSLEDGMARCWDLTMGTSISQVYIGRNILSKSTLPVKRGEFLICMLMAETAQEFIATSVVVLCLKYDMDIDPNTLSYSPSNVQLSVLHRSSLDSTYPAMYPSCVINGEGVVAIVKLANSVSISAFNVFNGAECTIETDLTEIDVDYIDLAFNGQDLVILTGNSVTSWLYRCPKDLLPYDTKTVAGSHRSNHLINFVSSSPAIQLHQQLHSYERWGFYPSGGVNGTKFAATLYDIVGLGMPPSLECVFWDLEPTATDSGISAALAHRRTLPGMQFYAVSCTGSESGTWGAFACSPRDVGSMGHSIGHDFEIDVGIQIAGVPEHITESSDEEVSWKADIFLIHYDATTRTSNLYRPELPVMMSYITMNDIKSLEFDERLGVLYILVESAEGERVAFTPLFLAVKGVPS
ncbi:hypothetical protein BDP27DRAFT_1356629 [Rhodocollybia butyracea]|uniref:F-box domain-containing protein n=1 Tax=Rhodocollybia butyracea TaxID=206335 RepID=A0A9P5Q666_9AGAR|nr:hypothetical protein BDP27DRAFT_1356629 [Rhodocollybia butyracea]